MSYFVLEPASSKKALSLEDKMHVFGHHKCAIAYNEDVSVRIAAIGDDPSCLAHIIHFDDPNIVEVWDMWSISPQCTIELINELKKVSTTIYVYLDVVRGPMRLYCYL